MAERAASARGRAWREQHDQRQNGRALENLASERNLRVAALTVAAQQQVVTTSP